MIHELIEEEIMNLFRNERRNIQHEQYQLHCSPTFAKMLQISVLGEGRKHVVIDKIPTDVKFTSYRLPNVGLIRVIEDREQGYEINRITPMLGETKENDSSDRGNTEPRY